MEAAQGKGKNLFLFGSGFALVFGLLAAFTPGLAYLTVLTNFFSLPPETSIRFYPFAFGVHMFTLKLLLCSIGGAIGLFSLLERKSKQRYSNFTAIGIAALSLTLPAFPPVEERGLLEMHYFDMPWIGFLLVLAGVSVMFLALTLKNPKVPRIALLSVPLLLISYSAAPTMVLISYFPRIVFDGMFSDGSILIATLNLIGCLLLVWGAYKAAKPSTLPAKTV